MLSIRREIEHRIHVVTGLHLQVELVRPQTHERFAGKAQRVVDHRREKGLI